jgi:hypothetical protein
VFADIEDPRIFMLPPYFDLDGDIISIKFGLSSGNKLPEFINVNDRTIAIFAFKKDLGIYNISINLTDSSPFHIKSEYYFLLHVVDPDFTKPIRFD